MKSVLIWAFILLIPATIFAAPLETAFLPTGDEYLVDRFIVTTKVGIAPLPVQQSLAGGTAVTGVSAIDYLCSQYNVVSIEKFYAAPVKHEGLRQLLDRMYVFYVARGTDILSAVNAFNANNTIECSDPYFIPHTCYTPNDPQRTSQWHLTKVQAYAAWDIIRGDTTRAVIVGISDTGIYHTHPDLAANMWINEPEDINGNHQLDSGDNNGVDDDENGYVDDVVGWDFGVGDNNPQEQSPTHGTHVGGCVSEVTDNDLNGAGIGFWTRIMAAKGANSSNQLTQVWPALIYCYENGASIVNASWGRAYYSSSEQNIVNQIWNEGNGAVFVAAAGNDSTSTRFYPAAYTNVVAVAATTNSDRKAGFSNYGTWVDVSAPGDNIYATWAQSSMAYLSGTSMASPVTCGVLALIKAQNPSWTASDLVGTLLTTCDNIDALNPNYIGQLGAGRVNAYSALAASSNPNIFITSQRLALPGDPDSTLNPNDNFQLSFTLQNLWANVDSVRLTLRTTEFTFTDTSVYFGAVNHGQEVNNDANPFVGHAPVGIIPGDKQIFAHITGSGGYVKEDTVQITVSMSLRGFPKDISGNIESSPLMFDFDNDGAREIIFGASNNSVNVLEANGSPAPGGWPKTVSNTVTSAVSVGDVDYDGQNEVVAVTSDGRFYAWRANGASFPNFPISKSGTFFSGAVLDDIDGNNTLEIIAGSFSDSSVYVINSDGTNHQGWPIRSKSWYGSPATGDIDNDGQNEIVYAGFDSLLHVWNGDGTVVTGFPVHLNGPVRSAAAIGDVDHDGFLEIAVVTYNGSIYLIRHDGTIQQNFPVSVGAQVASTPSMADLNGDNNLEIIFGANNSYLHAFMVTGAELTNFPKAVNGSIQGSPVVGDITGDGQPDIFFGTLNGYIYGVDRNGADVRNFPIPGSNSRQITGSLALGDLDGNGTMEIVVPVKASTANLQVLDYREQALASNLVWPNYGKDNFRRNNAALNPVKIDEKTNLPSEFNLSQNYPNPFNATTSIQFSLANAGDVSLTIYDVLGRQVKSLQSGALPAGSHSIVWNGTDSNGKVVTSGVYFYRLNSSEGSITKRMVLLK